MDSREIIKRCIEFTGPERIGYDFCSPHPTDFVGGGTSGGPKSVPEEDDPTIRQEVPDFPGHLHRDAYGSIWGQLTPRHSGEVVKGVLQDGWHRLDGYRLPDYGSPDLYRETAAHYAAHPDQYRLGWLPGFPFAIMRYMRRMDHFLMDVLLNEQEVLRLNEQVVDMLLTMMARLVAIGADGVMFCEDWGTQNRLLVSPATWRKVFRPSFKVLVDRAHALDMHVIMHSCGYVYEIIEDLIEVGIDVLQFDQPALVGVERLAREFGGRVCFYSPVDIQTVLQTGDKATIQAEARKMVDLLGGFNGGFIAKDYGSWADIDLQDEWLQWARDVFMGQA
jgi:uroporphyrinogen decarboxylase